jgi:predicted AAA+ superfamily ATPase
MHFPLVIETFLLYLQRKSKEYITMIIGREKEQRELQSLLGKDESQFCAVYGRRRVGKTYLIRETFNYQFCFQR